MGVQPVGMGDEKTRHKAGRAQFPELEQLVTLDNCIARIELHPSQLGEAVADDIKLVAKVSGSDMGEV